jgi:hypothetical protein
MADDTTTDEVVQPETGADEALPVETTQPDAAVEETTAEPSEPEQGAEEVETTSTDQPEVNDKLRKYAASQGFELDSPSAVKAAQIAMKAQSEATRNSRKASELEKSVTAVSDEDAAAKAEATGQDPELIKRLQRVEVRENVRDFWNQEGIDRSFEPAMIDVLNDKPYLAGDLESLYATAVMKSGGVAAVKSQGKREALESLAHKQQAAVPTGSATTSGTPKGKDFKELSISEMEKKLGFVRQ